jgi:chromate transporter
MKELLKLFFIFAKIGSFTFGGGYAMLPMIQTEIVDKNGYATEDEVLDYYAIGQLTPGVIAVNVATFIGMRKKGMLGAAFATAGVVFPSVVIITAIALVLRNFMDILWVQYAFSGIRVAVIALIIKTIIAVTKKGVVDGFTGVLFALSIILALLFDLSSVIVILICAALALGYKALKKEGK